jgi:hypothetical protein
MRFLENKGNIVENYEDSNISTKDRTIDSFIEWIKLKTGEKQITKSEKVNKKTHHTKKQYNKIQHNKTRNKHNKVGGGKWSLKYKKSINY